MPSPESGLSDSTMNLWQNCESGATRPRRRLEGQQPDPPLAVATAVVGNLAAIRVRAGEG